MSNAFRHFLRFAFLFTGIALCTSVPAQQNRFVFIQSENSQSFYVRIGETVYNSSSVGHLTIHGLDDGTYRFAIGFPHNSNREQQFTIKVNNKNCGYQLKKDNTQDWVLYNWQTEETLQSPRTDSLLYGERKKDDGFASLMASVVNDSAVLYTSIVKADPPPVKENNPVIADTAKLVSAPVTPPVTDIAVADSVKKELPDVVVQQPTIDDSSMASVVVPEKKQADTVVGIAKDSALADSKTPILAKQDSLVLKATPDSVSSISKLGEQTSREEKRLVFLDNAIGIKSDTINVVIPLDTDTGVTTPPLSADSLTATAPDKAKTDSVTATIAGKPGNDPVTAPIKEKPVTDSSMAVNKVDDQQQVAKAEMKGNEKPADSTNAAAQQADSGIWTWESEPSKTGGLVMINSDCIKFATDHDLDKLRVKMLAQRDYGNRIFAAHKVFKNMCFTTKQVKALSELFPDDELRYRFFETAYPFVSDSSNFKTLEETLTDQFFITRFRTLVRR